MTSTNIWNLSVHRGESLSKADADRRNQLMESPSRSDGDLLRLLSGGDEKAFVARHVQSGLPDHRPASPPPGPRKARAVLGGPHESFIASIKAWCIDSRSR